ncbi:filament-like plant protein 4 isoform X2 [Panicum miliaceum]|uniref:Filament-like plant protein 4 isoform X2 n=1 Tax=Panicum miliaceum TaxID=4540 RepID=A0A3L6Q7S1_PANMI|nr:filament-like plant protein 4 isoform X2 [Panicum miliaceum]
MNETGEALRCCLEQLLLVRDEKERLVIEAANKISSEQKKTQDLQQKFEDANKQFEKVIAENHNLRNTVDSKEKLIKYQKESEARSDQKSTDATARLEFSQKQCTSLKYEVRMLREELEIRNKEREYDLRSIHAAQKQQQESAKKIAALEAECQRLRTMVQKRLPGPAALAKMKDEVKRQGASSAENGTRRPRTATQLRARHSVSEGYQVKMRDFGEENRHLRQLLAQKESDLQFVQSKYVDEACKLSILQEQHEELSGGSHRLTENNHPERMLSALAKLDHSRSGKQKQQVSQIRSRGRRIIGSDIQLFVDPMEIEKLERTSRPSSAPHQCEDTPDTDSKMVVSETVHRDLILDDAFSDKYVEWIIQDVLKAIIHKHQVSKISVASIIDEVTHALRSEISAKGNDVAHLSCNTNRADIDKMVATLIERVSSMVERSAKDNVMRFRSFLHEKSELTLRLEHLVHACRAVLDGTANLEKLTDEVCLILDWITSAISAAAKKLAECQETIATLSKQLRALESPAIADASDKEKRATLPSAAASLLAEADPKPEDLSPPTSEEAAGIKEHSEPDATEESPEHEDPGTGAKAVEVALRLRSLLVRWFRGHPEHLFQLTRERRSGVRAC